MEKQTTTKSAETTEEDVKNLSDDPIEVALLMLEKSITQSKIKSDEDSIPSWNHVKTGMARYVVFKEDREDAEEILVSIQSLIPKILTHFEGDKDVKDAIKHFASVVNDSLASLKKSNFKNR